MLEALRGEVSPFPLAACGFRYETVFHQLVPPVQIYVRYEWTKHSPLRGSAKRGIPVPLFQVSGPQKGFKQSDEASILHAMSETLSHDAVIETLEPCRDVAFNDPCCAGVSLDDLTKGRQPLVGLNP